MTGAEQYIRRENTYSARNYNPLDIVIESAQGVSVTDVNGTKYLDMLAAYGAVNQGHRHPKIMNAAMEQMQKLTLTSRAFRNDQFGMFAEKICEVAQKEKVLPMNTGAEAVETALKVARKWGYEKKGVPPDQAEIITCTGNFHGRTITVVSFSTEEQYKKDFGPHTPGFRTIPFGDVEALAESITPNTVGFLVEPIQAEGGILVPPDGYLAQAAEICKNNNVLFMTDEVQTGFGRTGKMFASQHEDVNPDILIVGKSLGGGVIPVSAVLADSEIMDVIRPGDHGSTFGGNPLASAVGRAAMEVVIDEKLPERAQTMGVYFIDQLKDIDSPHVREVRGKGLLVGVEVFKASGTARKYCEDLAGQGILAKDAHDQVIRFTPPLTITKKQINQALRGIKRVLH